MMKHILLFITLICALGIIFFSWGYSQGGLVLAWSCLDKFGLVLGIVSFVPLLYAVWQYIKFTRQDEKERKRIHAEPGSKPAVLIVSIGGVTSIRNDVERFLKDKDGFQNFDFDQRVFVVHYKEQTLKVGDVDDLIKEVEAKQDEIRSKSADKIHLFMKAPMPIAIMVGKVLANQTPTLVYHKHEENIYENWGALRR